MLKFNKKGGATTFEKGASTSRCLTAPATWEAPGLGTSIPARPLIVSPTTTA